MLEGYAAHLQIVFDHYASNEVLDEQGFHAFLRDCHVSPDPLPDNAVARIFNSGARGKGELGFEEFCECLERVSVKAFQVMGLCCHTHTFPAAPSLSATTHRRNDLSESEVMVGTKPKHKPKPKPKPNHTQTDDLSESEAMVTLLQSISRCKVYTNSRTSSVYMI